MLDIFLYDKNHLLNTKHTKNRNYRLRTERLGISLLSLFFVVNHVQQSAGIQDKQQATHYTQQALNVLNEHGNNNPQGLQSMFSGLMGGQNQAQQGQQNNQKKKGLLGDVMGGLGI